MSYLLQQLVFTDSSFFPFSAAAGLQPTLVCTATAADFIPSSGFPGFNQSVQKLPPCQVHFIVGGHMHWREKVQNGAHVGLMCQDEKGVIRSYSIVGVYMVVFVT